MAADLPEIYKILRKAFGHQKWWPGETPFEVIIGAILTQNTSWTNVEKAIHRLKRANKLSPHALKKTSPQAVARLIRPAGYFNVKAKRIHAFLDFLFAEYQGDLDRMFKERSASLRAKLLLVNGIGPETADSILLYAGGKSVFVIDAYTKRIFDRHQLRPVGVGPKSRHKLHEDYEEWQNLFKRHLPRKASLFKDYHGQLVRLGKDFCKAKKAFCNGCPLENYLH